MPTPRLRVPTSQASIGESTAMPPMLASAFHAALFWSFLAVTCIGHQFLSSQLSLPYQLTTMRPAAHRLSLPRATTLLRYIPLPSGLGLGTGGTTFHFVPSQCSTPPLPTAQASSWDIAA